MIQSNGKNRAEDNVIRQMRFSTKRNASFVENLHFDVLICAKGFKFVKIGVFTFEKNIFIIKILV